ncbi:catechol 2,3-dioxygenase-like lactoylglutathione lyase family enzyme [Lysinibacillus parviboronicapiens]|uniref:Catechol 2,3-dioxygenase-like lactoylglutathione lyase family enzyme n=1 Tax=Lysinibacillus parviboronicapiens TaxID=436516 RepID=A0ABV2PFX7_9BACI|nr:VOC family protein [Lysinibacillus parviboronicapiens]
MNTPINKTPIKNRIGGVFVPVRDLEKASNWYSKILGLQGGEIFFGHLYTAPMDGTAGLLLDTMPKWRNEVGNISTYQVPAIQFLTNDIQAAYQFMKENNVELVTEIEDDFYFVFKDPDGNLLMICRETA